MSYTSKTRRAIKRYGLNACLEAFRMHDQDGHGAYYIACALAQPAIQTTRQADAAIDAGREIAEAAKLHIRAFTQESGHFDFDVTFDEWRAELPKGGLDAWSLPLLEYQLRAVCRKAAIVTPHRVLSIQVLDRA